MARLALVISLAGFALFNVAQYRGWNLFADDAGAQAIRSPNAARAFHK